MNKSDRYQAALKVIKQVLGPDGYQLDIIGKMAAISSVLKMHFPEWIFVGFYRVVKDGLLEIGPYQGAVLACGTIKFGQGVCGAGAREQKTIIVKDVSQFPGYIACDSETRSEIVVPVIKYDTVVAVLDVDSNTINAFDKTDRKYLEEIVVII